MTAGPGLVGADPLGDANAPYECQAPPVDGATLRATMGRFTTGVSVVTSTSANGSPIGSTANAVSSVSLDPPLVLVCLREQSETLAALLCHGRFAINVLRHEQLALAERFSKRTTPGSWRGVTHRTSAHELPLLEDALASIECAVHDLADGGDHTIVIGRVLHIEHAPEHASPLVFYRGSYSRLDVPHESTHAHAAASAAAAAAVQERVPATAQEPPSARTQTPAEPQDVFMPTREGDVTLVPVERQRASATSVIVLVGSPRCSSGALVYVHRGCLLADAFGHLHCLRRAALERALQRIRAHGTGVLVYHRDDSSPFAGCCAQQDPPAHAAASASEDTLAPVREAIAELGLREVRLLYCDAHAEPRLARELGLNVAAIEALAASNTLPACGSSPS